MRVFLILMISLIFLSACGVSPRPLTATPRPTSPFVDFENIHGQVVTFTTEDNVKISATLYGDGPIAVILAHMGLTGVTQKSWQPFAKYISTLGYSALTLDFRGRGLSEGALNQSNLKYDIDAAVRFLRDQGYQRIVCMGTSMGGAACLRAVIDDHLDGLVVIAGPFSVGIPTSTSPAELEDLTIPTLFITAKDDPYSCEIDIKVMYAKAPEPRQLILYEGVSAHGTDLFFTSVGTELRDGLVTYLSLIPK